jgi:hypothetical protein
MSPLDRLTGLRSLAARINRFRRWLIVRRAFALADTGRFDDCVDVEAYLLIVEGHAKAGLALDDRQTRTCLDRRCWSARSGAGAA